MRFRRCSIGGVVYGDAPSDEGAAESSSEKREKEPPVHHNSKFIQGLSLSNLLDLITDNVGSSRESNAQPVDSSESAPTTPPPPVSLSTEEQERQKQVVVDFVMVLALCHTVVLDAENGSYQSESPVR